MSSSSQLSSTSMDVPNSASATKAVGRGLKQLCFVLTYGSSVAHVLVFASNPRQEKAAALFMNFSVLVGTLNCSSVAASVRLNDSHWNTERFHLHLKSKFKFIFFGFVDHSDSDILYCQQDHE